MTTSASQSVGTDVAAVQQRTLRVLLVSQVLAGAGLAAGVTVGALLAQEMLRSTSLSGLPAALMTLGSAAAALGVGRLSQRWGRRPGLAAGYLVGATGGIGSGLIVAASSYAALGLADGLIALALVPAQLLSRPGTAAAEPTPAGEPA